VIFTAETVDRKEISLARTPMGKYSETTMDHVLSPRNGGVMENPHLTGHAGTPGRGAFLVLFLRVEEGRIAAAKYHTVGCGPTIACGSILSELVVGRTIAECRGLTAADLIGALDGGPPGKLHCPAMAIAALQDALGHWEPREDS
jgi:nitrogen fixation protein NifU and related proteins